MGARTPASHLEPRTVPGASVRNVMRRGKRLLEKVAKIAKGAKSAKSSDRPSNKASHRRAR